MKRRNDENEITHRSMMEEYILYYRGKVFGGLEGIALRAVFLPLTANLN